MFARTHRALSGHPSRDSLPHWCYRTALSDGVILHACVQKKFMPHHRKIVVIMCRGATSSSFRGGQFSWNSIRWRHRAYSTVVQLFRKRSHIITMYYCPQTRSP